MAHSNPRSQFTEQMRSYMLREARRIVGTKSFQSGSRPSTLTQELVERINRRFNSRVTPMQVGASLRRHGWTNGGATHIS